jgi:hypothetical protein
MALNFNATNPAAPAGSTNVTWQNDASGNVSAYVASTGGTGPVNSTGNTNNIPLTTIITPSVPALYRVTAYMIVTTADGVSSSLPQLIITWTDRDNATGQTSTLLPTNNGNTLTTFQQATMEINSSAANIQYQTTGYASNTPATMAYALRIRIEPM